MRRFLLLEAAHPADRPRPSSSTLGPSRGPGPAGTQVLGPSRPGQEASGEGLAGALQPPVLPPRPATPSAWTLWAFVGSPAAWAGLPGMWPQDSPAGLGRAGVCLMLGDTENRQAGPLDTSSTPQASEHRDLEACDPVTLRKSSGWPRALQGPASSPAGSGFPVGSARALGREAETEAVQQRCSGHPHRPGVWGEAARAFLGLRPQVDRWGSWPSCLRDVPPGHRAACPFATGSWHICSGQGHSGQPGSDGRGSGLGSCSGHMGRMLGTQAGAGSPCSECRTGHDLRGPQVPP